MIKTKVSIVKANEYNCAHICGALEKSLGLIGGLEEIVKPDSRVFVKINHLPPASPPERGIVTHPIFVEAVLELLKKITGNIIVGDDIESEGEDGFMISGFRQMCNRAGIKLINLKEEGFVEMPCNGHYLNKVYLSRVAVESNIIINLPKLKTHSLTVFTGGVKNMYGTIPASFRTKFHGEYPRIEDFTGVITDIYSAIKPQLTIMDGIMAMEGEGPASGNMRELGVILASTDAVAVDTVATKIIGLEPGNIYTTRYSNERGLGAGDFEKIEIVGESVDTVAVSDFKHPAGVSGVILRRVPKFISQWAVSQFSSRPRVIESKCTLCGDCQKICPVEAITIGGKMAIINYDKCIRCMCCHEVCRFDSIVPRFSLLGRILKSFS